LKPGQKNIVRKIRQNQQNCSEFLSGRPTIYPGTHFHGYVQKINARDRHKGKKWSQSRRTPSGWGKECRGQFKVISLFTVQSSPI
jgi:hypothetical protein